MIYFRMDSLEDLIVDIEELAPLDLSPSTETMKLISDRPSCPICLTEIMPDQNWTLTFCEHFYHTPCLSSLILSKIFSPYFRNDDTRDVATRRLCSNNKYYSVPCCICRREITDSQVEDLHILLEGYNEVPSDEQIDIFEYVDKTCAYFF